MTTVRYLVQTVHMETTATPITITADTLATISTAELFALAAELDRTNLTAAEFVVQTAIHEVIESRFPIADAMNAWADDVETELTYTEALLEAVDGL